MSKEVLNDESAYHTDYGDLQQMHIDGEPVVKTLDRNAGTCHFIMLNDIHGNVNKYRALLNGVSNDNSDVLILLGDMMSYVNDTDKMLECVFGSASEYVSSVPVFYVRGNHETRGRQAFLFQKYNPTSTGETYFMLRHGPVALLVLDAGEDKPDTDKEYSGAVDFSLFREQQLAWLKEVVADSLFTDAPVKVALMHIPPFNGEESWYGERLANEMLVPVLNDAGVDIMLSGHYHEHIYVEPGRYGNNFPILANDHMSRLDFYSDGNGSQILIYDVVGNVVNSYKVEN
jgi:predicted phosphodiesterase